MNGIDFLKTADGSIFDVCSVFYTNYLKDENDRSESLELFRHLISRDIISDQTHPIENVVSQEEYLECAKEKTENVEKFVDKLIQKEPEEDEFYSQLWTFVFDNVFIENDKDIICVLICLVINPKIPYFKLDDPVDIGDDEFNELMKLHYSRIQEAEFIMNLFSSKKTKTASQLLGLLKQIDDERAKSVVLANALGVLYERISVLSKFISKISEDDEPNDRMDEIADSGEHSEISTD